MQDFKNVLSSDGIQAFIEWLFSASDDQLEVLQIDNIFKSDAMIAQVEEACDRQIKEFKDMEASFTTVANTMKSIIEGVSDIFQEFETLPEKDVSSTKRQALEAFFTFIKDMAQKVLDRYPREDTEIFIELVHPNAVVPQYKNLLDAGADIYSPMDYTIQPGETVKINSGFKVSIPKDWKLSVRPRSGLSLNTKMRIANAPGTIEPNYLDEVGIIVDNIGDTPIIIKAGERPCQLVLERRYTAKYTVVSDITEYASGNRGGGFGHTGK